MCRIYGFQLRNCVKLEGGLDCLRNSRIVRNTQSEEAKSPKKQMKRGYDCIYSLEST